MSSIIVKGMKMPENCGKCPFIIEEDIDFDICRRCGAGKSGYIYEKDIDRFPSDCPLVALPDHHGRLVDADALEPDADYDDGDYWAYSVAQVCNAPTIVEKES